MSADFSVARALAYADAWVQGENLAGVGNDRAAFATLAAEVRRLSRDETPVELFPGLPALPKWVFDACQDVERYMSEHHPGYWSVGGVRSMQDREDNCPSFDMDAAVEAVAALFYNESTGEPWTVAGVEHSIEDRDYYRTTAQKFITAALPHLHDESVRRDAERWRHLMRYRYVDDGSGCILIDSHRTLPWEVMNDATDTAIRAEKEAGK